MVRKRFSLFICFIWDCFPIRVLFIYLSKNNNKVLLVDGNLRNPTQHIAFNVQNKGLTNAVMMDEDLTIHRNVVPHLDVLTAGEVVEYPSDIVDSSKLPTILEYVRDEYDVIIIDTPPVLSVTDAVVLAEKSDGVILVVKNEVASPKDLIEAKKRLSQVGISLLGSMVIDA